MNLLLVYHHLQVVVLQAYKNESNKAIEAKYVFPLDDTAAVCGFEAFINNKHIIGTLLFSLTGPRSAVGSESNCRSRGCKFYPGSIFRRD